MHCYCRPNYSEIRHTSGKGCLYAEIFFDRTYVRPRVSVYLKPWLCTSIKSTPKPPLFFLFLHLPIHILLSYCTLCLLNVNLWEVMENDIFQARCTPQSAAITDPTMPQLAAQWPSPRNVFQQRLAIFSNKYYHIDTNCYSFTYPKGMEGWVGLCTIRVNNLLKVITQKRSWRDSNMRLLSYYSETLPLCHRATLVTVLFFFTSACFYYVFFVLMCCLHDEKSSCMSYS